ncbi:MATE family efflux transporter [Candidatus Sulfidibacterium hydrothermale]|uniref:MATE family efflux transporter n=1 Tax=Candidatus Sulfidibacterium hydrothermale TaxID=2875962 RepID=UPI001F0A92CF|nr:MATE family efflux transporter [Candidatus Sulfidibacterium hydrothermale]UBM63532.1 MATE family efflux transporter [Candidatus Sulfidibacterium hydrothermale]
MEKDISYKRIWYIAYPIILGSIAQNLINFTDTAFLGRVGEVALGAGALGGIFYLAVFMLGLGFGMGEQIIVARRYGEKKQHAIGSVVDHSFLFLMLLAVAAFLLLRFGSVEILRYGVHSRDVAAGTKQFLDYRAFGIFAAFVNVGFRSFYVGLGRTKVITYTTVVLAVVNIILDYLLIFGKFGFPEMGIAGVALASVIAEYVAALGFFLYTVVTVRFSDFSLFRFRPLRFEKMQRILKVSFPTMMQQFVSLSVWFVFFLFVEKIGKSSLAVSNIIRSIYVLLMVPIWGFATAANTLVSYLIGAGRSKEVMRLVFRIIRLCFLGVMLLVLAGVLFPRALLSVYTNDALLIRMGIPVLHVISLGAILLSVGFVLFSAVAGTGKTQVSLFIELTVLVIYLVYTYLVVECWHGTVVQAWTAEWIYGLLLSLFSFLYLKSYRWEKTKI